MDKEQKVYSSLGPMGRYHSHVLVLFAAFLWGTSFPVVRVTLQSVDPLLLSSIRLGLAGAFAFFVGIASGRMRLNILKDRLVISLALLNSFGFLFQHTGMSITTASRAALLINANVVLVAILSILYLGERISKVKTLSIMMGLTGIVILNTQLSPQSLMGRQLIGDILVVAAGAVWSVYIVVTKRALTKGYSLMPLTVGVLFWTAIFLSPLSLLSDRTLSLDATGWLWIIYLSIICSAVAFFLWVIGLKGVSATVSSILLLAEVLFAVLLSVLFLSELLTLYDLAGGTLILLAIILSSVASPQDRPNQKKATPL